MRLLFFLLTWFAAGLALSSSPAHADPADIEAASRGVVRVIIVGRDGEQIFPISHGTGFSVGAERIVTNAHVIQQAVDDPRLSIGIVPADGAEPVYARLVSISRHNDLALLATTEPLGLPPLIIAGNPSQSGAVTAIGYPANVDLAQGLTFADIFRAQPPVTATGFLSGRRPSREFDTLLHTAPIGAGNSGGPIVDDCGRVVGVNSFGAESQGADAEFFFAVSNRELLPFLRANDVTPRINSSECRSLASLDAEERARRDAERAEATARSAREEQALAARTAELRRAIGYEVMDQRANGMALTFLLLIIAVGAGTVAAWGHAKGDFRLRAFAGAIAVASLVGALVAWFARPPFSAIDSRVEESLREEAAGGETGPIAIASATGAFTCVLDNARSRVTGDPAEDITLDWSEDGCVNARTQYGLSNGEWTRVFVPANEAAVSVNRYDPDARELVMERYLLGRDAMTDARAARGQYQAPSCGAGEAEARELGSAQATITSALPDRPNERLVYRCSSTQASQDEN